MGRRKLKIERLDSVKERQSKYSKRKSGILKKAKELSVLCEVDLALIMFSPAGKPSVCVGQDKDLGVVLQKLSSLSIEDREEKRFQTLQALKKICSKTDSNVDTGSVSFKRDEELKKQRQELKEKLAEKKRMLREWQNPEQINDMAKLRIMEEHLISTINGLKAREAQLQREEQETSN